MLLQHSLYLFFAIIFYFFTVINSYSPQTKIKCRKDMYSRLSILGAVNTYIPYTEECYACLYAIKNNDEFYKSCLGHETELGYRNFSDLAKNGCQKEFKCYTCYTDNCNIPSDTNGMFEIPKFKLNSLKCYYGEREASQFQLQECPAMSKRCVIMHNFEHRYWATSCDLPDPLTKYYDDIFPASKNLTIDYYYCNTSECNYNVTNLHGTTQAVPTWMKNEESTAAASANSSLSNNSKNFNVTVLNSQSMLTRPTFLDFTTFTVIGKALPNATSFRITLFNYYDYEYELKLIFNIKKQYVALILPPFKYNEGEKEYRRNLTAAIDLKKPVEIVFNSTKLFINRRQYFNYSNVFDTLMSIAYGGEWNMLAAYKVDSRTGKKETLVKTNFKNFTVTQTCSVPLFSEKKIYYFPRGFQNNQTLLISPKGTLSSSRGVIALRLQSTPCGDNGAFTDIPLYMILSWGTQMYSYLIPTADASERANITRKSPKLTNNIIYGNPKLTIWSRYGSQWSEGKVYSLPYNYYSGPKELRIEFLNNSLRFSDKYYDDIWKIPNVNVQPYTKIRYLVVMDPFSLIKDFIVNHN